MAAVSLRVAVSALWLTERRVVNVIAERRKTKVLSARVTRTLEFERERKQTTWSGTRQFRVIEREYENANCSICSFSLAPCDNQPIPSFRPGQFLTFEFPLKGSAQPATRCYSISSSPTEKRFYRITVKRLGARDFAPSLTPPGLFSSFFHDRLVPGSVLDVYAPAGAFRLNVNSNRPVVLIAAGVGLTPLISMIDWLIATKSEREIWFFYGLHNSSEHAMYGDLKLLARTRPNFQTTTFYSRPGDTCREGIDYDYPGHISVDAMRQVLKNKNCEFYICGPSTMMETVTRDLTNWGVSPHDIKQERFSPLPFQASNGVPGTAPAAHTKPIQIRFNRSNKTVRWTPSTNSLLELAEASGVPARFGCRAGNCGTCMTALRDGEISYNRRPGVELTPGSCLLCISQPKTDLVIDL